MSERRMHMTTLIAVIVVGIAVIFLGIAVVRKTAEPYIFFVACIFFGIIITSLGSFELGREREGGKPRYSIEPGRYTIVKVVNDYSFVTDRNSRTFLLLKKDAEKDPEFYALPTNELQGTPIDGGILEVSEVPSSLKMLFRK